MQKDFLDELIEALLNLKEEQNKISIPKPVPPSSVFKAIDTVIKNHKITTDELSAILSLRNLSSDGVSQNEFENIINLQKSQEDKVP